jgi:hypothetical protein
MSENSPGIDQGSSTKQEAVTTGIPSMEPPAEGAPYAVTDPGEDELPITPYVLPGPLPLPSGFYLSPGVTGQGKSTTALATKLWLAAEAKLEGRTCYKYVGEPRSRRVTSLMLPQQWQYFVLTNMIACRRGFFAIDSVTYNLANLPLVVARSEMLGDVTYKGGLSPRDVFAVLLMTAWAVRLEVVVVGTLNSELFPVAGQLGGAAEGELQLLSPGLFKAKSRSAGRYYQTYAVPERYVDEARQLLGVTSADSPDERRSSLSSNLGVLA